MKAIQSIILSLIAIVAWEPIGRAERELSPTQIRQCVPQAIGRHLIDSISPIASTQYQSANYVLLLVTSRNGEQSPQSQFPMILEFSDQAQECRIPFLDPMEDGISYSAEVPEPVAHSLMLQQWKNTQAKLGGKLNYEKYLTKLASGNNGVLQLNRDEFWAFQQLGLKLPSTFKVKVLHR